jgi:metal transporter CNNM
MLHGALKFREMTVQEIMTPAAEVFMVPLCANLDVQLLQSIFRAGYSRIPVYDKDKNDVVGVLLAKDLLLIDPKEEIPIRNFMTVFGRQPIIVWPDQTLGEILNLFSSSHKHMCVVRDVNSTGPVRDSNGDSDIVINYFLLY